MKLSRLVAGIAMIATGVGFTEQPGISDYSQTLENQVKETFGEAWISREDGEFTARHGTIATRGTGTFAVAIPQTCNRRYWKEHIDGRPEERLQNQLPSDGARP